MRIPIILLLLTGTSGALLADDGEQLREQLRHRETSFAQSMADRDHAAFSSHLAEPALFFGGSGVLRGRAAVAAGWQRFFEGPTAPFSWQPEEVEVLDSGDLGLTSGPVLGPSGERLGTFNSVWRRETDGVWRVVFDKGCPPCDCAPAAVPSPGP